MVNIPGLVRVSTIFLVVQDFATIHSILIIFPSCAHILRLSISSSIPIIFNISQLLYPKILILLVVWNIFYFSIQLGRIIPTDELIFVRGVSIPSTSNRISLSCSIYPSYYIPRSLSCPIIIVIITIIVLIIMIIITTIMIVIIITTNQ